MVFALLSLSLAACGGGGGDLEPSVVTSIPPGDATGSALTGEYAVRRVTRSCSGRCAITVSGFLVSACEVGEVSSERLDVVQRDGALEIEASETPSLYEGRIDADGSFDIGGYATESGGQVHITARAEGVISGAAITGTARSRTWGSYDGESIDCRGAYELMPDDD
jgi:hypothetical protein